MVQSQTKSTYIASEASKTLQGIDISQLHIVMLAAGESRRFGSCKLLAKVDATSCVIDRSLSQLQLACKSLNITSLTVVTGGYHERISAYLSEQFTGINVIFNPHWQQGMASSIAVAAQHLPLQQASGLMLILADQIALNADDYIELIKAYQQGGLTTCSFYQQQVGVPAIFTPEDFPALQQLRGSNGAKHILKHHQQLGHLTQLAFPQAAIDIDIPADLTLWLAHKER